MSSSAVDVEVRLKMRDGATAGLKAASQAAEQSASKSAVAAEKAASKSVAAVQAQHDSHIKAYQDIARARETLGVRSERVIRGEIAQTQAAYQTLAKSGAASSRELARAQDATLKKVRELRKEMGEVEKASRLTPGAVAGMTGAAMLAKPAVTRAVGYDHTVAGITNTLFSERDAAGRIAGKAEVKAAISAALKKGGGDRDQAAATLNELLSSGEFSKGSAFNLLGTIQQASTASNADSKDLSAIALALKRAGISEDRIPAMLSKTIRSGQLGGFELNDMAKSLPEAMALARKLGMTGEAGFERLLVSMQSSVLTAGTKSGAANNLANLLGKIDSQDTATDFKKLGINLTDELAKGALRGEDRITTFTGLIDRVVQNDPKMKALAKEADRLAAVAGDKKDPKREEALKQLQDIYASGTIGKVLQDRQALMGFLAEKQGQAGDDSLARRVREGIKADNGQELEASFAVMNDTVSVQTQRLSNAKAEGQDKALTGAGGPFKGMYQGIVSAAEQFPLLTASVSAATAAIGLLAASAGINAALGAGKGGLLSKTAGAVASRLPMAPKGAGLFGLAAGVGGALLSTAGEDSLAARYGSSALSGAGLGATIGSIIPGVGTLLGAAVGGVGGLAWEGIKDLLKPAEQKPVDVNAKMTVSLAPGLVLQGQSVQSSGGNVQMNTGNVWNGAP